MRIGIIGCNGKVGIKLVEAIFNKNPAELGGGLVRPASPLIGQDIGKLINVGKIGIKISGNANEVFAKSDVLIDFTNSTASINYMALAAELGKPIIVGTTGFNDSQENLIRDYATKTVIVKASNMSIGVNLLFQLVEAAAKVLNSADYDIEILEKHHKHKKDAPSGTALTLGGLIAKVKGDELINLYHSPRKGISSNGREQGKIGFSSIRGGNIIGEHSVFFVGEGEIIELKHTATNRNIFVNGALQAAAWAIGKPTGLYSFKDVINDQKS